MEIISVFEVTFVLWSRHKIKEKQYIFRACLMFYTIIFLLCIQLVPTWKRSSATMVICLTLWPMMFTFALNINPSTPSIVSALSMHYSNNYKHVIDYPAEEISKHQIKETVENYGRFLIVYLNLMQFKIDLSVVNIRKCKSTSC